MTYWTLPGGPGLDPETLCDDHALFATNLACAMYGLGPFWSMVEASVVLNALMNTHGESGLDLTSSETGECGTCAAIALFEQQEESA